MILYGVKNLDFVVGTSPRGKESLHSYSLLMMGWTLVKLKQQISNKCIGNWTEKFKTS
jgi:hypothetical protein